MALYPKAQLELIPPGPNDPVVDVMVGTIGHVAVSMATDLHDYFNGPSGGVESHFYILLDGTVKQYRDTKYEADANYMGNSWAVGSKRYGFISYETQGMGDGTWTDAQLAAIKDLIRWTGQVHGCPFRKASNWQGPGHGYHCLFSQWNYPVHSCPGAQRVVQFNNIIVPWLDTAAQEVDVTPEQIQAIADAVWAKGFTGSDGKSQYSAGSLLVGANKYAGTAGAQVWGYPLVGSDGKSKYSAGDLLVGANSYAGKALAAASDPAATAQAVAAAIPVELAKQVVDELNKRLSAPDAGA